jgi:hypothetical protein
MAPFAREDRATTGWAIGPPRFGAWASLSHKRPQRNCERRLRLGLILDWRGGRGYRVHYGAPQVWCIHPPAEIGRRPTRLSRSDRHAVFSEFCPMKSKWLVLGLTAGLFMALVGSLSVAQDDDETPIHAHMEKVQKNQGIILKYWAKRKNSTKEETVKASKELLTLSEGIKAFGKEEAEKDKKPVEEWNKLSDAGTKAVKEFSEFMGTDKADAKAAKEKYKTVTESCNACHDVFNK